VWKRKKRKRRGKKRIFEKSVLTLAEVEWSTAALKPCHAPVKVKGEDPDTPVYLSGHLCAFLM